MTAGRTESGKATDRLAAAAWAIAAVAILLGIFFRFASLGAPLFWQDEAYTALRVTGHTDAAYRRVFDGRTHSVAEVRSFVTLDPKRGVADVARALAAEEPQHPPAFYVLDRLWIGSFGSTPAGFRGLSALLGVLGIALAFTLGATLGGGRLGGALFAGLFALSPLFVLYARQASEYGFFADATLLGTLLFAFALRSRRPGAWGAYAATVALGAYVDPIYLLVAVAHGICALFEPQRMRALAAWALACTAAALLYLPWLLAAMRGREDVAVQLDWARTAYPLRELALKWIFNLAALGFDGEFRFLALAPVAAVVIVIVAGGVAVSLWAPQQRGVRLALVLGAVTLVFFVARDALYGAHYETIPRYLMPLWVGLLLSASLGFAHLWRSDDGALRAGAFAAWILLLGAGTAAALIRGSSQNWWDNNDQIAFQQVASRIDRAPRPLVISEAHWHVPLVLGRYVRADGQFLLFAAEVPPIPAGRNAFVVTPTAGVLRTLLSRTRGSYTADNVSPAAANIIATFHRSLMRDQPALERGNSPTFVPDNALYRLRPSAARTDFARG
ncbi:MAG: glycosyltransferase family 39 protein [Candidatus Eremiobacteraeota bacterium]|nr:glycosyltransferase family 39 protein [Candidatus Eremiobacteraeota bacterium]